MEDLLFLVHRIPYPPNKGDKIRSFHFLNHLCTKYRIHLGAFVDDPDDLVHGALLNGLCESVHLVPVSPKLRKLYSIKGLLTGEALSLPYYDHPDMASWVNETIASYKIEKSLIFSSTMAQYVRDHPGLRTWIDFVDVDSDKWRQYSAKKSGIARYVYHREAQKLLSYERDIAKQSVQSFFVSEREAELFKHLAPDVAERVDFINNGVDLDFFSPEHKLPNPYDHDAPVMVFTGAMDYWANVDAVCWFAEEVFPQILRLMPEAEFYIVGSKPTKVVQELSNMKQVYVTGRVEDVRPYLAHANLVVAPMRIARGIQNKVLEGLAMNCPILTTPAGMEGIEPDTPLNVTIESVPSRMAHAAVECLSRSSSKHDLSNRQFVLSQYGWRTSVEKLLQALSI